jgi:hypothetical protein
MTSAAPASGAHRSRRVFWLLLAAFAARLAFGLVSDFWGEDERQIYLIGLKYYTTGQWPFYGPDVVYTQTQVPGALQGLLVGGPLFLVAEPEAPYVLLNLLSFAALLYFGWYIGRRFPDVPRWFLWPWLLFAPWTLDISTHIINTSYVMSGAVVFFISAFELLRPLRIDVVRRGPAAFGLGAGLLWVAQLHLSAALLVPIAAAVLLASAVEDPGGAASLLAWFTGGALLVGSTLIPTVLHAGLSGVAARTGANLQAAPANLLRLPQVAAQFFSFGTFELPRFIGANTNERLAFLIRYAWASPAVVFAALCGVIQTGWLLLSLGRRTPPAPGWFAVRTATLVLLGLVYVSFAFSVKPPASHAFYVAMPVVMIYAFACWNAALRYRSVRVVAVLLLAAGAITHVAIAMRNFADRSLYTNRPLIMRAIQEKNYHLVGERRE